MLFNSYLTLRYKKRKEEMEVKCGHSSLKQIFKYAKYQNDFIFEEKDPSKIDPKFLVNAPLLELACKYYN